MSSLDNETPNSGTEQIISRKTLESELRPSVYKSVSRYLNKTKSPKIPNHENLRVGDIVLSRPLKRGNPAKSVVEAVQIQHDFLNDAAYWTHASLYVGDLHIVESQIRNWTGLDWVNPRIWRGKSSVQVAPITKYSSTHEITIFRNNSEKFSEFRGLIARYALLDHAIYPRKYDWITAAQAASASDAEERVEPNHTDRINCSEFILECYAIGGSALVSEYNNVSAGSAFFLPANFYAHPSFERINIDYYKISD